MAGGRPPKFESVEQLQELIDQYFAERAMDEKPMTVTGMALHLGTTRETLCDYEAKPEFSDAIKLAKARVEQYAEERLYTGPATGPIFALKNFGWRDTQELNHGGQKDNPIQTALPAEDKALLDHYMKNRGKT